MRKRNRKTKSASDAARELPRIVRPDADGMVKAAGRLKEVLASLGGSFADMPDAVALEMAGLIADCYFGPLDDGGEMST